MVIHICNLSPIGFYIGGEELHNNHHAHNNDYRFGKKWWELDLGAWIIERIKV